jgi:hypothetical protein
MSQFKTIMEQLMKEAEDKAQIAALDQAMGAGFNVMGSELKTKEDELKADVQQADVKVTEAIGAVAIIGMLLAAPKVVELVVKGFSKVVAVFKKLFKPKSATTPEQQSEMAAKIIEFTHKWHKSYIKGLKWVLKVSGMFAKAGIKDDAAQTKAAELIYYTIIAGLAVYSGIGAFAAFKSAAAGQGGAALGSLEAAMATIKSGEVTEFLGKLGLKIV